jgi:sugar transferase (PEP-CTERM/EpsH1 system associated)
VKILYVCHRFPFPPRGGGRIRAFHTIKHLARVHAVTVASLLRSEQETADGAGLRNYCESVIAEQLREPLSVARMLARLPTTIPSTMGYFYSPQLARRIHEALASTQYDLLLVHCSSVAQYVAGTTAGARILDFGDLDSQKWLTYARYKPFPLSLGYWLEGLKLQRAEKALARQFDLCTCATWDEWKTLDRFQTARRASWFPNGVDTEFYTPGHRSHDADTLCFVGAMDYFPNEQCMLEFCATTLPLVRARRPATQLLIVGAGPSRRVRRLGSIPGVTVTGFVPDVRPYLQRATVALAPLTIARGVQNKVLEALAMGVPVVCSTLAARGVDAKPGEHLLTADSPGACADAIVGLLERPAERQRLATAGRARALSHLSWSRALQQLDDSIAQCVATRRHAGVPLDAH